MASAKQLTNHEGVGKAQLNMQTGVSARMRSGRLPLDESSAYENKASHNMRSGVRARTRGGRLPLNEGSAHEDKASDNIRSGVSARMHGGRLLLGEGGEYENAALVQLGFMGTRELVKDADKVAHSRKHADDVRTNVVGVDVIPSTHRGQSRAEVQSRDIIDFMTIMVIAIAAVCGVMGILRTIVP